MKKVMQMAAILTATLMVGAIAGCSSAPETGSENEKVTMQSRESAAGTGGRRAGR